ncbi:MULTISPECIES: general stress protein [Sporosarcina]|uniref:general stress protein n=1 Tax=Sporosarcina TaxID=1569 RepID=UPI0006945E9C|nr:MULTISPECIES: general stress protein [Sporosarcina]WJY26225.1 general stress protein [Sporosarcina sp. 0.2-SM1T-5]
MENGKRFIGMYETEEELLSAVQELKTKGYDDRDIYVVAKREDDVKMLQRRTDAEIETTHESWLDKFMDFMTGEDRVRSLLDDLGFSDNERAGFYQDVNDGHMLLLVEEQHIHGDGQHQEMETAEGLASLESEPDRSQDTWVAPPGDGVSRPPEQPAFGETAADTDGGPDNPEKDWGLRPPEYSSAADDTITNGAEITDLTGELGLDPEQERRRQEFQNQVNRNDGHEEEGLAEQPMRGDFFYERDEKPGTK